mmetsp:Transcript_34414/g.76452  ORF Transcript_34414/g.76452 Transcript_34414/m.76452 type:complete len:234 (+) Transcript_34414:1310-2011(+)
MRACATITCATAHPASSCMTSVRRLLTCTRRSQKRRPEWRPTLTARTSMTSATSGPTRASATPTLSTCKRLARRAAASAPRPHRPASCAPPVMSWRGTWACSRRSWVRGMGPTQTPRRCHPSFHTTPRHHRPRPRHQLHRLTPHHPPRRHPPRLHPHHLLHHQSSQLCRQAWVMSATCRAPGPRRSCSHAATVWRSASVRSRTAWLQPRQAPSTTASSWAKGVPKWLAMTLRT